jgi:hypothetical protein
MARRPRLDLRLSGADGQYAKARPETELVEMAKRPKLGLRLSGGDGQEAEPRHETEMWRWPESRPWILD